MNISLLTPAEYIQDDLSKLSRLDMKNRIKDVSQDRTYDRTSTAVTLFA